MEAWEPRLSFATPLSGSPQRQHWVSLWPMPAPHLEHSRILAMVAPAHSLMALVTWNLPPVYRRE